MRYTKTLHVSAAVSILVILARFSPAGGTALSAQATATATLSGTPFTPRCALIAPTDEETGEATSTATASATGIATETASAPLRFINLEPYDLHFNPNRDKPFAVVMNLTLFFENRLSVPLDVRRPQFRLIIEDVLWGDLASTDFSMGTLQARATHGIALQSLMLLKKATDPQKAVLECIKAKRPVDLTLLGTMDTYENGEQHTLDVRLTAQQVVLPASN